jgi:hypothetical protein
MVRTHPRFFFYLLRGGVLSIINFFTSNHKKMDKTPKRYVQINVRNHPTQHLTEEEKENPWLVFATLYDITSVTNFRGLVWKSFSTLLTGSYNELTSQERDDVVFVYDYLLKLAEASHLINEHEKLKGQYGHHRFIVKEEEEEEEDSDNYNDESPEGQN